MITIKVTNNKMNHINIKNTHIYWWAKGSSLSSQIYTFKAENNVDVYNNWIFSFLIVTFRRLTIRLGIVQK